MTLHIKRNGKIFEGFVMDGGVKRYRIITNEKWRVIRYAKKKKMEVREDGKGWSGNYDAAHGFFFSEDSPAVCPDCIGKYPEMAVRMNDTARMYEYIGSK